MNFKLLLIIVTVCLLGCNQGGLKLKVRFDDIDGLKSNDRIYRQEKVVGVVTEVIKTDENNYMAALTLKKEIGVEATQQSRFYIDQDPKEDNRPAIIMVAEYSGGAPLQNGDVVDGSGKPFALFHRLQKDGQQCLQEIMSQFDQFSNHVKKIFESEKFRQLENDLKALVDKTVAPCEAAKKTIEDEIVPKLEKQLNIIKDKLKALGRENEVAPLEVEFGKLRSV